MAGMRVVATLLALALSALLALPCHADGSFVARGEVITGYRLDHFERHPEYLRLHFVAVQEEVVGDRTVLEIVLSDIGPGPWSTGRHRLMPAPEQQPPVELMRAVMYRLQRYDANGGPPLIRRKWRQPHPAGAVHVLRVPPLWLVGCLAAGAAWALLLLGRQSRAATRALGRYLEARPWPYLALLLSMMAVPRLLHLDTPFSEDAMTQRLLFGSLDVSDIVLHRYDDQRHPQLYYLILHAFLWFGHSETVARLPAVVMSLASAAMLFVLARPRLGAAAALLATALLGLNLAYLIRSREVGDLTLFTFLTLCSSHLLLRALREPRRFTLVALAVAETAMFYAYYLAALVALVHLLAALLHTRDCGRQRTFGALGLAWLAALPSLWELVLLVREDMAMRDVARAFPTHMWGERTTSEMLADAANLFVPNTAVLALMVALALIGALRLAPRPWRDPFVSVALSLLLASFAVLGAAVLMVRVKPYYLLFGLPFLVILVIAGAVGGCAVRGKATHWSVLGGGAGAAALLLVGLVQAEALRIGIDDELEPRDQPRYADLGSVIRDHARSNPPGPRTVIADGNNLHTILLYYAFDAPLEMYRTCAIGHRDAYGTRCRRGRDALITLTLLPKLHMGWELEAVARLHQVQRGRESWVVYVDRFPNAPLFHDLEGRCELVGKFDKNDGLDLFRCPPR